MELTSEQERVVKKIMRGMDCPKEFRCHEAGFENRKTGKPINAWMLLCEIAKNDGKVDRPTNRDDVSKLEKAVQELRKRLNQMLGLTEDPFEKYRKVRCYKAKFKISFPNSDQL